MAVLERGVAPSAPRSHEQRTAAPARSLPPGSVVGLCSLLAVLTAAVVTDSGPVLVVDRALAFAPWAAASSTLSTVATAVALVGQRGYSAPELLVVGVVLAWRRRMLRPATLALAGLLLLNVGVGAIKLVVSRPSPLTADWLPFAGGTDFPSGHTSNTVLTWGLLAWLVLTFSRAPATRRRRAFGYGLVAAASLAVGLASLYLRTHWLSDIVAGWVAGLLLLLLVIQLGRRPTWARQLSRGEQLVLRAVQRAAVPVRRKAPPRWARQGLPSRGPSDRTPVPGDSRGAAAD